MTATFLKGDCRETLRALPAQSVHCVVTSPPYWAQRVYQGDQAEKGIGNEATPELWCAALVEVFAQVKRVLRDDGVLFLNIGDKYAGSGGAGGDYNEGGLKAGANGTGPTPSRIKDMNSKQATNSANDTVPRPLPQGYRPGEAMRLPHMLLDALVRDGWLFRAEIIWYKSAPMPSSFEGWRHEKHRIRRSHQSLSNMPTRIPADPVSQIEEQPIWSSSPLQRVHVPENKEVVSESTRTGKKEDIQREWQSEGSSTIMGAAPRSASAFASQKTERKQPPQPSQMEPVEGRQGIMAALPTLDPGQGHVCESECQKAHEIRTDRTLIDGSSVGGSTGEKQTSLFLLQGQNEADDRPRNPSQQGRQARSGERGASLPVMQRQEAGQDDDALIDCPGCKQCAPDGFILRRGSWRPTTSHEVIYMLTKGMNYYCDAEAVRETTKTDLPTSAGGGAFHDHADDDVRGQRIGVKLNNPAGRNARSVQAFAPQPFSKSRLGKYAALPDVSHFALFPPSLPDWCIRAATSEKGVCPACGSQWARVVIKRSDWGNNAGNRTASSGTMVSPPESTTVGWRATCSCPPAEPVGATVLDPFSGASTTGLAAHRLGRNYIGCELSEEYIALSKARLLDDAPMLAGGT